MTVRVFSDQAGTTAAAANDNIGKVEDLSKFDSDGVSSTTGPYLSVDANGFGSADILAQGGDVVQTFTNAISDGSALVVGTSKCIFFSNVNVEAGGTLTIGPAGDMINTNGLNLVGKVVSVATTTKVLTTAEQNSIATFFAQRGASSVIVNDETVYDVNSVEADVVLDFTGDSFYRNVPHYFKLGGTYTTFADAFTGTSPKLTYSTAAGSNSTMVNSEGKIVWAPHNLLDYSEDFDNGAWSKLGAATIDSTLVTGPDGTLSGRRVLNFDAGGGLLEVVTIANSTLTGGLWVKGEGDNIGKDVRLEVKRYGGTFVGTDVSHTLTADWERIHATFTQLPDNTGVTVVLGNPSTNSASEVLVYGAHVYRSDLGGMHPVPGAATGFQYYVPTNGSAEYLPRVGHHVYNGTTWVNEGLLIESEPRTNFEPDSNPGSPASWPAVGLDYSGQILRTTGPDGVADSMFKLQESAATGIHYFLETTSVSAGTNTFSCIVKDAGDGRWVYWRTNNDGANQWINVNPATGEVTEVGTAVNDYGVIDLGNGFYRLWFSCDSTDGSSGWLLASSNTATPGNSIPSFAGTLEAGFYCGFIQLEAGSTPSSYMPTSGNQFTRTAQSLTVPPAEFGWPEPEYIGPELVDNGDFSLGDNGDWTKLNASITTEGVLDGSGGLSMLYQDAVTNGRLYHVSFDATVSAGEIEVINNDGTELFSATTSASHSFVFKHAIANGNLLWRCRSGSNAATIDNISVREINPLSVSIQMDGRMTYADTASFNEVEFYRHRTSNGQERINAEMSTFGTYTGRLVFSSTQAGSNKSSQGDAYTPGVNVPFNISSRHGSTFIRGATDGVLTNLDTTPTALPDLSGTNLQIAYDFMGTIGQFRQFAGDIGDTGLVTATNPSTEPTLSLTFDGTSGSFYNLSWSE